MSIEEKFNAAVNVIRSLPKSGSYQPSNELMLRFYSYFKQATEGPCDKPKPGFWDVVNRAKWESWNRLGNMTKDEAMRAYVDELHKIVETMSYSDNVASFLSATDDEQAASFPAADLELVAGDVLERVRHTPLGSRSVSRTPSPPPQRHAESDEEFIDTIDSDPEPFSPANPVRSMTNGHAHQYTQPPHFKVLESLPATLSRLERDVAALRAAVESERGLLAGRRWRWPWQEVGPATFTLLIVWPFVAMRIHSALARRQN